MKLKIDLHFIVLLSYDSLLTFGDEVAIIWKGRWRLGQVLYIMARYFTLVSLSIRVTTDLGHKSPLVRHP